MMPSAASVEMTSFLGSWIVGDGPGAEAHVRPGHTLDPVLMATAARNSAESAVFWGFDEEK
jgi:hypothetical protein